MKRTHDNFYINEDNTHVKDSFIAVADAIGDGFKGSMADLGCATGAFPHYLNSRFPEARIVGIEYLDVLLKKAKEDFPNLEFVSGDITDKCSVVEEFDVITMIGVLAIFDDYPKVLGNVLSWLKPKGRLILLEMINNFDIDTFVKYKPSSGIFRSEDLESGWNIFSKKSLQLICEQNGATLVECNNFEISVDLSPNNSDPMRSWTELDRNGRRQIYNALQIRQPQQIAIFESSANQPVQLENNAKIPAVE